MIQNLFDGLVILGFGAGLLLLRDLYPIPYTLYPKPDLPLIAGDPTVQIMMERRKIGMTSLCVVKLLLDREHI
jgi:hypothetical protein